MATLDDSGMESAIQKDGVTPVTSKKRPLVNTSGRTPSSALKKRKVSVGQDRSKWIRFDLDIHGDDFLLRPTLKSDSVTIEGSEWFLAVHRRLSTSLEGVENVDSLDGSRSEGHLMMEVSLECKVPSPAWCAKCKIDLEITTDENTFKNSFDTMITSSANTRSILLEWRKYFLQGGRVAAYLLVSRVCNKYLSFPDFSDPQETGSDELHVGNQILYVDKNLLSLHSKFFSRMFTESSGPYRLPGRVDDIVACLRTVYPQKGVIDESNAFTIAVIAKEFEFWDTLERCEKFLLSSGDTFSTLEKMEASLGCQMHSLLSQSSEGINSMEDVLQLMDNQRTGFQPNEKTKAHLFDLILAFNKKLKVDEEVVE